MAIIALKINGYPVFKDETIILMFVQSASFMCDASSYGIQV